MVTENIKHLYSLAEECRKNKDNDELFNAWQACFWEGWAIQQEGLYMLYKHESLS